MPVHSKIIIIIKIIGPSKVSNRLFLMCLSFSVSYFIHLGCILSTLPAYSLLEPRYQTTSPCVLFHNKAPTELTRAMVRRIQNKTRICTLVTFSTFDLFRGALVEF